MARDHSHTPSTGGPDDGAETASFDWWRALDMAVWAGVIVIAALGLEWAFGKVVRERIATQTERYLSRTGAPSGE